MNEAGEINEIVERNISLFLDDNWWVLIVVSLVAFLLIHVMSYGYRKTKDDT